MKTKIFKHNLLAAGTLAVLGFGVSTSAQAAPEAYAVSIQKLTGFSLAFSNDAPAEASGVVESTSRCTSTNPLVVDADSEVTGFNFPPDAPLVNADVSNCNSTRGSDFYGQIGKVGKYGSGDSRISNTDIVTGGNAAADSVGEAFTDDANMILSPIESYSGGGRITFTADVDLQANASMNFSGSVDYLTFAEIKEAGDQSAAVANSKFVIEVIALNDPDDETDDVTVFSFTPPELNAAEALAGDDIPGGVTASSGINAFATVILDETTVVLPVGFYSIQLRMEQGANVQLVEAPIPPPVVGGDHYLCYKSFGSFLRQEVNLVDQFDDVNFDVLKPKMFCNPAIKPIRDPEAFIEKPEAHLLSYKINEAHREPRHERQTVKMKDQFFDALELLTVNPDRLMVPSGKSLDGSMPNDPAGSINHFKCYRVRTIGGFQETSVNIADQFTDDIDNLIDPLNAAVEIEGKDLVLVRPTRMCTPVSKNGEGILVDPDADPADPRDHLMCYRVKADRGVRLNRRTEITSNNQFREEELVLKRELEFCAPATKTVVTGIETGIETGR